MCGKKIIVAPYIVKNWWLDIYTYCIYIVYKVSGITSPIVYTGRAGEKFHFMIFAIIFEKLIKRDQRVNTSVQQERTIHYICG